jgi:alanyl-tRNA synthetase
MLTHELRQKYIEFFKGKGHLHLPSAPLIPYDHLGVLDTSTLYTSAGMHQFKPYFTGAAKPPHTRITTVQKCLRTGDLDEVGDYSHCTFFEMLGNFSFGDYFKAEVIPWTWEFLTEWLHLDPDRLCVTIYLDDDEAFQIWHDVVGLPADRIHRLGEDKNYWPANAISEGPNGPCGPCTEVFYRVAPLEEMTTDPSLTPVERYRIDDKAGRWLEIWNNVFTQYDRQEDRHGKPLLVPLPAKNNDTGAGLDRIATLLQGKQSVFDTDLFAPIIARIEERAGQPYTGTMEPKDFAFRVVAEHTRAMTFCIADGILPSNEGRGYVLRRLIRRATRFAKTGLGLDEPFLHEIAPQVIQSMGETYPELIERTELILKTIHLEEERFLRTLDRGMELLDDLLASEAVRQTKTLPGKDAFTLFETHGFPLELTREMAAERGVEVDMVGFGEEMQRHIQTSRRAASADVFRKVDAALAEIQQSHSPTEFFGYDTVRCDARVIAIIRDGELVPFARRGEEVEIVLDRTPFYAEAGGQVGDTGLMEAGDMRAEVLDTQKAGGIYLHRARILEGELQTDQMVEAVVDHERRRHIMRNHTATHLLQAALRQVLGGHVYQKGSLVAPDRLRFDFTHPQPMTDEEIAQVEEIVNAGILDDREVLAHTEVPIAEARSRGAMALFGEKYGDTVRMIEIPGISLELCGGTHLARTSQAGLFKILSETGIASGVRRIEAVTGAGACAHVSRQEETLSQLAHLLRTTPQDLLTAAEKLVHQRSELEKQVRQLKMGAATGQGSLETRQVGEIAVITGRVENADGESLAAMADREAQRRAGAVIALGSASDGKAIFVVKVTPDLTQRGIHAGSLIREVARIAGGGGGGRPDFAQAGGRDASKIGEALAKVPELVEQQLQKSQPV